MSNLRRLVALGRRMLRAAAEWWIHSAEAVKRKSVAASGPPLISSALRCGLRRQQAAGGQPGQAAGDHGLDLSVEVPEAPVIAFVDPGRMQQGLYNLLENSMRYTPPGGTVRVTLRTTPEEARIEVADSGVGIPEGDLPFVFERFFRSDRARRAYSGGSGLGLSIVRWIVEAHKGVVDVKSAPGEGTTFRVRLPLIS